MSRSLARSAPVSLVVSILASASPALAEPWDQVLTRGSGVLMETRVPLPDYHSVVVKAPLNVEISEGPSDGAQVYLDSNLADRLRAEVDRGVLTISMAGRSSHLHKKALVRLRTPTLKSVSATSTSDVVVLPRKQRAATLELRVEGTGDLVWRGGDADALTLAVSGSGDLSGRTRAKTASLHSSGSGETALQLDVTGVLELSQGGSGDIELSGSFGRIAAVMEGSGDLELQGSASELTAKLGGSGDLDARKLTARSVSLVSSGSGEAQVTVRNGPVTAEVSGSGDVTWRGSATTVKVTTSGSGRVREAAE